MKAQEARGSLGLRCLKTAQRVKPETVRGRASQAEGTCNMKAQRSTHGEECLAPFTFEPKVGNLCKAKGIAILRGMHFNSISGTLNYFCGRVTPSNPDLFLKWMG